MSEGLVLSQTIHFGTKIMITRICWDFENTFLKSKMAADHHIGYLHAPKNHGSERKMIQWTNSEHFWIHSLLYEAGEKAFYIQSITDGHLGNYEMVKFACLRDRSCLTQYILLLKWWLLTFSVVSDALFQNSRWPPAAILDFKWSFDFYWTKYQRSAKYQQDCLKNLLRSPKNTPF